MRVENEGLKARLAVWMSSDSSVHQENPKFTFHYFLYFFILF